MIVLLVCFTALASRAPGPSGTFRVYDSLDVHRIRDLAIGDLGEAEVLTPLIAITPGDFLHVVWCQGGRVYCRTTLSPVDPYQVRQGAALNWSVPMEVSEPGREPASNCFVEAQGESLFVVWRGPSELGPNIGEIYRRRAWLRPPLLPIWQPIQNVSYSPTEEPE